MISQVERLKSLLRLQACTELWPATQEEQFNTTLDDLLNAHAHALAEKQRETLPKDAPPWVKVIPDVIDP